MEEQTKTDRVFNRRINFYIIRTLWQTIHGKKRGGTRIHEVLHMSRSRYERFINGEHVRVSEAELKRWVAMGIPKAVITGTKYIGVPFLPHELWVEYFALRDDGGDYKELRGNIHTKIAEATKDNEQYELLYNVCQFIIECQPRASSEDVRILAYTSKLSNVTIGELVAVNKDVLKGYIDVLQEQLELSKAIRTIREHSEAN